MPYIDACNVPLMFSDRRPTTAKRRLSNTPRARRSGGLPQFQAARRPTSLPCPHAGGCAGRTLRVDCWKRAAGRVDCVAQWCSGGGKVCDLSVRCRDMLPAGHQGREFLFLPHGCHTKHDRSSRCDASVSANPANPRNEGAHYAHH